jgi:hypothetical protein
MSFFQLFFLNGPFHISFFPKLPFHVTIIGLHFNVTPLFPPYTQLSSNVNFGVDLFDLLDTK